MRTSQLSPSLRTRLNKARSAQLAGEFVARCRRFGVPEPVCEFQFAKPDRKWAVDFAWPRHGIALECEGGVWTQGRHTRGKGAIADMEKYNELASRGYRLFRVTPEQLSDYGTLRMIARALDVHLGELGTF